MKMVVRFTFSTFLPFGYHISTHRTFVQAIHTATNTGDKKQAIYKLFAAYIHTIPLEELIESVERARLDAKLRYVVIYGAGAAYGSGPDPTERLPDKQLLSRLALEPQRISGKRDPSNIISCGRIVLLSYALRSIARHSLLQQVEKHPGSLWGDAQQAL